MYEVNIIYCLLADILVSGGCLRFGNIHFLLAGVFYLVGHLRLESSCIWVNMVL
jgi:hypothetical protein